MRDCVYHPSRHGAGSAPAVGWIATLLLVSLATLGGAAPAQAFGPTGHRIVGHIADQHLCAPVRIALKPLLAGMTLADAGTWPDRIRREPEWQHTKPWHYLNVSDRGSVAEAASRNPDNVLTALARFEGELRDSSLSNERRGYALRFIAHFVADIHQPLHVGRKGDRGGNRIPVRVGARSTNLHAVWDAEVLRISGSRNPRDWVRLQAAPSAADVGRWQRDRPLAWAMESQGLRTRVYAFDRAGGEPFALAPDYLEAARALTRERLKIAGVRLAGRLNAAFAAPTGCSGEVASR